jgi:hypothetical protein
VGCRTWTTPIAGAPTSTEEYAEFAGLVAERYAGKVSAYEIWNEPNTYVYWAPKPDAAAYTELSQAAYPAIKAADPGPASTASRRRWSMRRHRLLSSRTT